MNKKICISVGLALGVAAVVIGYKYYTKKQAEKKAAEMAAAATEK